MFLIGSSGIIEQLEQSERSIKNKISETNREIKELQPCDYEIELKKLNNQIYKLKKINLELQDTVKRQSQLVEDCVNYVKKIDNVNVKTKIIERYDFDSMKTINIEYVTIPEFKIARVLGKKEI